MTVLFAVALAGIGSYLTRAVFILLLSGRRFPPLARRVLEYVAPAVMSALVVSMLGSAGGELKAQAPEIAGLLCAALLMYTTRNHSYSLIGAMMTFWIIGALS